MSHGRQLRLFLVDGTPNGLITAEILNWTGHVLTGPRSKLTELVQRPECSRTGVYFLVGPAPESSLRPQVYIGESDDVAKRLKQHNRPEDQGGKDFWEKVCLVTSKDQNLTKSHVKFLEALLIDIAGNAGRCELLNGTAHDYANLPEADRSDMAFFLEQIRTVLPVLGFDFLRESAKSSATAKPDAALTATVSPCFVLELAKHNIRASAQEINGEFVVLKGSQARKEWVGVAGSYESLFKQLYADGVLKPDGNDLCIFTDDYAFSSPSAAAAVVSGRSANGRITWLIEGTKQTYGAWQDQQVSAAAPESNKEAG